MLIGSLLVCVGDWGAEGFCGLIVVLNGGLLSGFNCAGSWVFACFIGVVIGGLSDGFNDAWSWGLDCFVGDQLEVYWIVLVMVMV